MTFLLGLNFIIYCRRVLTRFILQMNSTSPHFLLHNTVRQPKLPRALGWELDDVYVQGPPLTGSLIGYVCPRDHTIVTAGMDVFSDIAPPPNIFSPNLNVDVIFLTVYSTNIHHIYMLTCALCTTYNPKKVWRKWRTKSPPSQLKLRILERFGLIKAETN